MNAADDWVYEKAEERLCTRFKVGTLDGFGLAEHEEAKQAAAALVHYIEDKNQNELPHLHPPKPFVASAYMHLDYSTRNHLELFRSNSELGAGYTLFETMNDTQTSMGARTLKKWIHFPLNDFKKIHARQDFVEELSEGGELRESLRKELSHVYDLERLIGKIASSRSNARDLVALRSTLARVLPIRELLSNIKAADAQRIFKRLDPHKKLSTYFR